MKPEDKAKIQQALEALELNNQEWKALADSGDSGFWKAEDQGHYKQTSEAITALRQLLEAEPVQEPVAFDDWPEYHEHAMGCGLEDRGITDRYEAMRYGWDEALDRAWEAVNLHGPLYTTPPAQPADHGDELTIAYLDGVHTGKQIAKREWVGLTDEEIKAACAPLGFAQLSPIEVARAIEAKLREKNGGGA
jgi:hypothetical protein